jgi:adenylate cyclase
LTKSLGKQFYVASISAVIGALLTIFVLNGSLQRLSIDVLNYFAALEETSGQVVVIGIDDTSFSALDEAVGRWPWPRWIHGDLIDSLNNKGVSQIIFDVIFSETSDEEIDLYFADAISRAERVVLASDLSEVKGEYLTGLIESRPIPVFEEKGALVGLAGVDMDSDRVVRYHPYYPDYPDTLSSLGSNISIGEIVPQSRILRYAGPDHTFPYLSYYQLLIEDGVPEGFLDGKTVLIGLDAKASADVQKSQQDSFPTPFTRFNARQTPGVEIHANLLDNLLQDNWVTNPPDLHKVLVVVFMTILSVAISTSWRPTRTLILGVGINACLFAVSFYFWGQGYFLNFLLGIPTFAISYVAAGGHAYLTEGRQKRQIKGAFGQYLSPAMVDSLIADPEKLKLGGERRKMTIMFCDVRGFTTISEALKDTPEKLTEIINILLTNLTKDVLECNGTIDKYMGDCIMAFWNAPVEDEKHASNAVEAARRMIVTMERVNQELKDNGKSQFDLKIGVGLGTGYCVVGNMGSDQRFDYTVLGDVVNLSSRLEGQTKTYGMTAVLSSYTVDELNENNHPILDNIVEIDKIKVKGKKDPEIIFGLSAEKISKEEKLIVGNYLKAFRKGDLITASLELDKLDEVAKEMKFFSSLMKERINDLQIAGLPDNWEGVFEATSK